MATVFEAAAGRLDAVIAARLVIPRAEAQRAIGEGRVLVDGTARSRSFRLRGGERVAVDLTGLGMLAAEGPPVEIRHRDPYLLVVSKPAGLPTHPTQSRRTGTLVNRLVGMGVPLSGAGGPLRPGIVHRLDAGTSGLMIVACDDDTHAALVEMLARHAIDRRYLALVRGVVEHDRFAVDARLGRAGARIRVHASGGRQAETRFETLERFEHATLLEAAPRTGRTHQIRVHLSAVRHSILGDARYGGGGEEARRLGLSRPFLHSFRLSFEHPRTGGRIELEDALPADLEEALGGGGGGGRPPPPHDS
ncbi:MAG: RluA family pseudouridine synthase [Actinomycetota bacterium]